MITREDCSKHRWAYAIYTGPTGKVKIGGFDLDWIKDRPICVPVKEAEREDIRLLSPGTILKLRFQKYGFNPCDSCLKTARNMDANGPDWCQENFELLVEEIHSNFKKRNWLSFLVSFGPAKTVIRKELQAAINDSIENLVEHH